MNSRSKRLLRAESVANGKRSSAASSNSNIELGIEPGSAKISMSALEFLDTNVLVYAYDLNDPRKQQIAQGLVRRAVAGEIAASSQVLGEFAATLLHKLTPAVKPENLIALLDALGPIKLIPIDGDVV